MVANRTAIDGELDHDGGHGARYITGLAGASGNVIAFPLHLENGNVFPNNDREKVVRVPFRGAPRRPSGVKGDVCPDIDDAGRIGENERPFLRKTRHAHPP